MKKEELDLLKRAEDLTAQTNELFKSHTHKALSRYPITFALLILFGSSMVFDGVKNILKKFDFLEHNPWLMLLCGMFVLVLTGTLYKKLDK